MDTSDTRDSKLVWEDVFSWIPGDARKLLFSALGIVTLIFFLAVTPQVSTGVVIMVGLGLNILFVAGCALWVCVQNRQSETIRARREQILARVQRLDLRLGYLSETLRLSSGLLDIAHDREDDDGCSNGATQPLQAAADEALASAAASAESIHKTWRQLTHDIEFHQSCDPLFTCNLQDIQKEYEAFRRAWERAAFDNRDGAGQKTRWPGENLQHSCREVVRALEVFRASLQDLLNESTRLAA